MATRELLAELAIQYSRSTGEAVSTEAGGGVDVARRVQADEPMDVVVLAVNVIDQLISAGKVVPGSRMDLVRSGIAVAVRAGAPVPDIGSEEAVRAAVLAARTLGCSTGPSGTYLMKLFQRWGIADTIGPRMVQAPPGVPVGSLVAKGQIELGFQQLSELMNVEGITVAGALPDAIQSMTVFSAGIATASQRADAARALAKHLSAPGAAELKRRFGMEAC